jgi:hypothetical protein
MMIIHQKAGTVYRRAEIMFIPISADSFIEYHLEANPGADADVTRRAVEDAVRAKKDGAKCYQCGSPIWAAGSAVAGINACFTCITGEADTSENFEIESAM